MIMNKYAELFKSRKFIFLFSAAINLILILVFRFGFNSVLDHNDLLIIPVFGMLFGPYAILGCSAVQIVYWISIYPISEIDQILLNMFVIFILCTTLWKLWYSIFNKHGYDTPNLNKSYNFIKFFSISLIFLSLSFFLFGFDILYLEDMQYILWRVGLFISVVALYLCNYLKIPLYSPRVQFRKILPEKVYTGFLILALVLGVLFYLKIIDFSPALLMVIFIIIFLFKPYDQDVFNIKDNFDINIASKLIYSLFLVLVVFLAIILLITIILLLNADITNIDYIILTAANYITTLVISFLLPAYIYMYILERNITEPISKISTLLSGEINSLEDNYKVKDTLNSITAENEIKSLANSLLDMGNDLMEYRKDLVKVTADNERFKTELEFAENIQTSMIPNDFDNFCEGRNFNIAGLMKPAREVGGDFYDYFQIDEDNVGFVIGDVDGKGIPAALIMVKVMTLIQDYAKYYEDLSKVFFEVNNQLYDNYYNLKVNCWLAKLNVKTGELNFVNAAHKRPLIKQNNGIFKFLSTESNLVLASMKDAEFKSNSVQLKSGDELFLYVDGVTEAKDENNNDYGEDRLIDVLNNYSDDDLNNVINHIENDLDNFYNGCEQYDDITMFMIKIKNR